MLPGHGESESVPCRAAARAALASGKAHMFALARRANFSPLYIHVLKEKVSFSIGRFPDGLFVLFYYS